MGLFDILQIFDWISPIVETGKDIHYVVTDGRGQTTIWLDKSELSFAQHKLGKAGIRVISNTWVAFNSEAGLDVPDDQLTTARAILGQENINNW